jgi:hypothetical protein
MPRNKLMSIEEEWQDYSSKVFPTTYGLEHHESVKVMKQCFYSGMYALLTNLPVLLLVPEEEGQAYLEKLRQDCNEYHEERINELKSFRDN